MILVTAWSVRPLQGTIRQNLDPMGRHTDRELIGVLKATRLWDILCGLSLSQAKVVHCERPRPVPLRQSSPAASGTPPGSLPRTPSSRYGALDDLEAI
jgi:hypothetical protein